MRVIFLDVDGVMTSARTGWFNWDIYAISFLNWICENANTKIVISSTWRYNHDIEFFDKIFPGLIHDDWRTKSLNETRKRGYEIKEWLSRHPEVIDYLILDDESDMLPKQKVHLIKTDSMNGLMFKQMLKITEYLTGDKLSMYNGNLQTINIHSNMFCKPFTGKMNDKIKFT